MRPGERLPADARPRPVGEAGERARRALVHARQRYLEHPGNVLAEAIRCEQAARGLGDLALIARAQALQGLVAVHRGDLHGALALAVAAERDAEGSGDWAARAEAAALQAQLSFFTGSYAEALRQARLSVELADTTDDLPLRIFARRTTCLVFGNLAAHDLYDRITELLAFALDLDDRYEEAICRNDLACWHAAHGDPGAAEAEIALALRAAAHVTGGNAFALGVIYSTRADIRLAGDRPAEALADAERAITLLSDSTAPNPYVVGATVRAEVQARMALGQFEGARRSGEDALAWLGDRVPQARSVILSTLAAALREAGMVEAAFDALARAADLEREAFRELSELQLGLERATLQARAARRESEALVAENRQLADAHAELERHTDQLEMLHAQLREQAERDWLTGLHNRLYLARELSRLTREHQTGPVSLALLDIDHFKSINDRFGHDIGDRVLVAIAARLCTILRGADIVVRSGGEEFLVLMPQTETRAAVACCERIRAAIGREPWHLIADGLTVTTSVGVASAAQASDLEALVKLADRRLYDAKRAGRDRVVSGPPWRPTNEH